MAHTASRALLQNNLRIFWFGDFLTTSFFFLRRYATLESNWDNHKPELSDQENLDAFNSFTPGYPYRTDVDMDEFIPDTCPNKPKVLEA